MDERLWQGFDDDDLVNADSFFGLQWSGQAEQCIIETQIRIDELSLPSPSPLPTPSIRPTPSPPSSSQVKLPKVELPTFQGESSAEYQTFINQFNSLVHSASGFDNVRKFLYLSACCQGEAKKIADGFNCTADNYTHLYNAFKETYGKPRLVQQSHITRILELEPFNNKSMKSFLNTLESSLRSLGESRKIFFHVSSLHRDKNAT